MRRPTALVLFLLLAIVLGACDPGASPAVPSVEPAVAKTAGPAPSASARSAEPSPAASERVTITFAIFEDERASYEPLIASFEAENPTIHVQLVMLDPFFSRGEPPEYERVIMSAADTTNFPMSPEAIANGWLRNLTPLIEADASFDRADFYPGALEVGRQGGGMYMMPRSIRIPVLFYNKDLWTARGLPAPTPDWTWADLLGAAEQLAQRRGDTTTVYGLLDWFGTGALAGLLAVAGVYRDSSDRRPLDDPKVVSAVERLVGLMKSAAILTRHEPNFPKDGDHPSERHAAELIRKGQIAIWSPDLCCYDLENKLPSFAVGVLPFPMPPFSNFTSVDSYVMSSGTAQPEAAWRWLAFLSRQDYVASHPFANEMTALPARRSVAEGSGFWQRLPPDHAVAYKALLEGPNARELIGARPISIFYEVDFDPVLSAAVSGSATVQAALREAQLARERQALDPSPTPDTRPIAVATPLPEAPASGTRISFGASGNNDDQLRRLVAAFNQQHPEIFVQLRQRDVSRTPPGVATRAAQTDCFVAFGAPPADQITATLDLQPLIDADPAFDLDDYPPALLAPFRHGNALHGLPFEIYFRTLHYNQTAFDAAGLAFPTAAWTLDDFALAAEQLTRGSGAARQYGFGTPFSSWRELFLILDQFGAAATTGSGPTLVPNFNDPKVRQAARFYLDLLRSSSPHARLTDYARDEVEHNHDHELIAAGRVAMWFSFGPDVPQGATFRPAVAPPPIGQRALTPNDFVASGLYISAGTQHREACWEWLKELSADRAILQGAFPARRSLADVGTMTETLPGMAEVYAVYRAALARTSSANLAPRDESQIDYYWLLRALDRALQGRDLERELAEAQALTKQFLACVRSGAKGSDCAKQVDPAYQGWQNIVP